MQLVTYLQNKDQLEVLSENIKEVIIETTLTSRFGQLNLQEALALARNAKEKNLRVVLEWDVLQTHEDFQKTIYALSDWKLEVFDAVRVQDPGALFWLKQQRSDLGIQLILETGNHNLIGLKKWVDIAGDQLERVVLSLELSKIKLHEYIQALKCPVEILGLGRILLFYTPRKLLKPQFIDHDDPDFKEYHQRPIEALGASEESPHSGFPLLENQHGTFMFNTKDHGLLEHIEELHSFGLSYLRIDLRFTSFELMKMIDAIVFHRDEKNLELFKQQYPVKLIKGYYNVNRSTRLFPKLKNSRIQQRDESFAAEVIDAQKDSHVGLIVKSPKRALFKGDQLHVLCPDGREKNFQLKQMHNSLGESLNSAHEGEVVFIPWISGMSPKAMAFWKNDELD